MDSEQTGKRLAQCGPSLVLVNELRAQDDTFRIITNGRLSNALPFVLKTSNIPDNFSINQGLRMNTIQRRGPANPQKYSI